MRFQTTISFEADTMSDAAEVVKSLSSQLNAWQADVIVSPPVYMMKSPIAVAYTDGGCDSKKGVGAWAYTLQESGKPVVEVAGPMLKTTNNRMEMMAVIKLLEAVEIGVPLLIHCDSEYVIKGVTQWSDNWKRNGWINSQGKPVINRDLWEHLLKLYELHSVAFKHVKGHSGIEGNERCDELCTHEMLKAFTTINMHAGDTIPVDQKPKTAEVYA